MSRLQSSQGFPRAVSDGHAFDVAGVSISHHANRLYLIARSGLSQLRGKFEAHGDMLPLS